MAIDPTTAQLYLTEDKPDGRWYRFTPDRIGADGVADLTSGTLEVARLQAGVVDWLALPDPSGATASTRRQVAASTAFNGGEGTVYDNGHIYFTTKGDNRVWAFQIASSRLGVLYDAATSATPDPAGRRQR